MKVHKVVLMVIDHDNIGAEELVDVMENARYPNRCISPQVIDIETKEVKWHDRHPLNISATAAAEEFRKLFGKS